MKGRFLSDNFYEGSEKNAASLFSLESKKFNQFYPNSICEQKGRNGPHTSDANWLVGLVKRVVVDLLLQVQLSLTVLLVVRAATAAAACC